MKKILGIIVVMVVALTGILLVSCDNTEYIEIYVPNGAPTIAASGLVKDGYTIDGQEAKFSLVNGDHIRDHLDQGRPDFALAPINLCARAYNLNKEYVFAGVAAWGIMHIVQNINNAGTQVPDSLIELKGEIIYAYQEAATPGVTLKNIIESTEEGLYNVIEKAEEANPTKINVLYVTDANYAREIITGQYAASKDTAKYALIAEPYVTANSDTVVRAFDLQEEWNKIYGTSNGFPQVGLLVRASLIETKPELVKKVIEAFAESSVYVRENAEAAATVAIEKLGATFPSKESVKGFIEGKGQQAFVFLNAADSKAQVAAYLNELFASNPKLIGGAMPDDGFYYTTAA